MADTGFKFPSANAGKYNTWTNPTYAYNADSSFATRLSDQDQATSRQSYESYAFNVPAGATIDGIEVEVQGYVATPGSSPTLIVNLYNAESTAWAGYRLTPTLTADLGTYTLGGSTDKWDVNWNADDFSDANFSLYWTVSNNSSGTYTFDYNKVKVYYTVASASVSPSLSPSTSPSSSPSTSPSVSPSVSPSTSPSPSISPSISPSLSPSTSPSVSPSVSISVSPSVSPSQSPSISPSVSPSSSPSQSASISPSLSPSASSSLSPSISPSVSPSVSASVSPSEPANEDWINEDKNDASITNGDKNSSSVYNQIKV